MLRWAKAQGAVTGYAHSASGLDIDPTAAAERLLAARPTDGRLAHRGEAAGGAPARRFRRDRRRPGRRPDRAELEAGHERAAETLPNLAIPEMNGVGAKEICVTVAAGALRLHQRDGHAPDRRMELLVPPAELRVPAEGQRRDRLPLHERHAGRPGTGLRPPGS